MHCKHLLAGLNAMTSDTEWPDSMTAALLAGHGGFDKRVVHDDGPCPGR